MKTSRKKNESNLSVKGQRYWSLMLVGEHGRVIPFRRFKEVAIAIFAIALLSLAALVVLGYFYIRQGRTIEGLRTELVGLRQYASQLKDEKDVLHARLGIQKAQLDPASAATPIKTADETPTDKPQVVPTQTGAKAHDTAVSGKKPEPKPEPKKVEPEKQKPPEAKWGADIQDISAEYDSQREILKATFRVYNRSAPKKKLSGRTVVVFKDKADPPIKWFAVQNVLLSNGQPNGDVGQAFSINNFITMRHHAYGVKAPILYDAVVIYVFSADGKLLASREADFKIAYQPPAPTEKKPVPPPKEPTVSPVAPQKSPNEGTVAPRETPGKSDSSAMEQKPENNATETPGTEPGDQVENPPAEPAVSPAEGGAGASGQNETVEIEPTPESIKPTP